MAQPEPSADQVAAFDQSAATVRAGLATFVADFRADVAAGMTPEQAYADMYDLFAAVAEHAPFPATAANVLLARAVWCLAEGDDLR